jgi:hypothetical protein
MRQLPTNFDPRQLQLDPNEIFIRDVLGIDLTAWARFREAIGVGTESSVLRSQSAAPISDEIRSTYCDFGRNHYAVICSLGDANRTILRESFTINSPPLDFHHNILSIYSSFGAILDSLSRIIHNLIV